MSRHNRFSLGAGLCFAAVLLPILSAASNPDKDRRSTLYAPDPDHSWNQLYSALLVRTHPDGSLQDDLLDPPLWANTKHLLSGESQRQALEGLRNFVADDATLDTMSPLHRAVIQRDLIAVFQWLALYPRTSWTASHRELAKLLARSIQKVALTAEEIRSLPDNLAIATHLPGTPTAQDPEHPERAFLPPDLLDDRGAWIALEPQGDDWLPATVHFKAFHGRSAFEVRLRHPDGRAAGEAYLRQLAEMPAPFLFEKPDASLRSEIMPHRDPTRGPRVNPETPQFPADTTWALVRRAVLADRQGRPVLSPLVESIQIRVYHALDGDATRAQHFFEWQMRRQLLLDGKGFHLTRPLDQRFSHFLTHGIDPFEVDRERIIASHESPARLNCFSCHGGAGIHSVLSRARLFEPLSARPPEFRTVTAARIAQMTEGAAAELTGWQLLRWLWEDQSAGAGEEHPGEKSGSRE